MSAPIAKRPALSLSLQFARDAAARAHRDHLPRHKVARWIRAALPRDGAAPESLKSHFAALEDFGSAVPVSDEEMERVASFAALELPPRGSPARETRARCCAGLAGD